MTTSTLDLVDLEHLLEPGCESVHGCDAVAEWIWVREHGCLQLMCNNHKLRHAEKVERIGCTWWQCASCRRTWFGFARGKWVRL